jgi:glycerol-3-phosphate responsive antiterminator
MMRATKILILSFFIQIFGAVSTKSTKQSLKKAQNGDLFLYDRFFTFDYNLVLKGVKIIGRPQVIKIVSGK